MDRGRSVCNERGAPLEIDNYIHPLGGRLLIDNCIYPLGPSLIVGREWPLKWYWDQLKCYDHPISNGLRAVYLQDHWKDEHKSVWNSLWQLCESILHFYGIHQTELSVNITTFEKGKGSWWHKDISRTDNHCTVNIPIVYHFNDLIEFSSIDSNLIPRKYKDGTDPVFAKEAELKSVGTVGYVTPALVNTKMIHRSLSHGPERTLLRIILQGSSYDDALTHILQRRPEG